MVTCFQLHVGSAVENSEVVSESEIARLFCFYALTLPISDFFSCRSDTPSIFYSCKMFTFFLASVKPEGRRKWRVHFTDGLWRKWFSYWFNVIVGLHSLLSANATMFCHACKEDWSGFAIYGCVASRTKKMRSTEFIERRPSRLLGTASGTSVQNVDLGHHRKKLNHCHFQWKALFCTPISNQSTAIFSLYFPRITQQTKGKQQSPVLS